MSFAPRPLVRWCLFALSACSGMPSEPVATPGFAGGTAVAGGMTAGGMTAGGQATAGGLASAGGQAAGGAAAGGFVTAGGTASAGGNAAGGSTGGGFVTAGGVAMAGGSAAGGSTAGGGVTADAGVACAVPPMGAGQRWVRQNPMFISGLTVMMGAPPSSAVNEYFNDFHATGLHLWESGLPSELSGWLAARPARWLSWVNLDGNSTANGQPMGGLTNVPPGRIGYQIGDEPLDMAALLRMQAGARVVRQRDAQGLTILNLTAGGAKGTLGTQGAAMTEFDVLSVDHYTYGWNAYETLGALRSIAQANGKPYWRYLDSFNFVGRTDSTTESDLRWDALAGVAYGYTGHSWFLYQIEPNNPELVPGLFSTKGVFGSGRAPAFQWAANLNLQLASLGRSLTQLRSTDVRYVASVLQPPGTRAFTRGAGGDAYLVSARPPSGTLADVLLGFFADDCGESYLFVQSQRHQGADFPNSSQSPLTVTLTFDFAQATDASLDRTAVLVLDPQTDLLAPRALTQTATGGTLDVVLPAGGGVLLKYKNGRPFVRQ